MAYNRLDYLVLVRVALEVEAKAYAVAARLVGPVLIVLGSLNNSLYPQLLSVRGDEAAMRRLTRRYARRLTVGCILFVPLAVVAVIVLQHLSHAFERLDLVLPVLFLALAVVPFAGAVPLGYLLTAQTRERTWLLLLVVALIADVTAVAMFGRSAVSCAVIWLVVQVGLWVAVELAVRRTVPHQAGHAESPLPTRPQ
jgi:O-antigen/teichoic acid export membrane protein